MRTAGDRAMQAVEKTLKGVSREMRRTSKDVNGLRNSMQAIQGVFAGIAGFSFAGLGFREITSMADSMQLLTDRIQVFEGEGANALEIMSGLRDIANRSKTSVDNMAITYNRLALSMTDVGIKGEALQGMALALQNTFRLSGSTIEESRASVVQLSQGLAAGAVRGQELRSVLEQNAVLGGLLVEKLNKLYPTLELTRGKLIKFGETGLITSQVVLETMLDNFDSLNNKADKLGQTFEQTLIVAMNNFKIKINEINKEFGISSKFAKAVAWLTGEGLPLLVGGLTTIAVAIGVAAAAAFPWAAALGLIGTKGAIAAASIGGIASAVTLLSGETKAVADSTKVVEDMSGAYEKSAGVLDKWGRDYKKMNEVAQGEKLKDSDAAIKDAEDFLKVLEVTQEQAFNTGKNLKGALATALEEVRKRTKDQKFNLKDLNQQYANGIITERQYIKMLKEMKKGLADADFKEGKKDLEQYRKELDKINNIGFENKLAKLKKEHDANKISTEAYTDALLNLNVATSNNAKATDDYYKELEKLRKQDIAATIESYNFELAAGVMTMGQYKSVVSGVRLDELNYQMLQGAITLEKYNEELIKVNQNLPILDQIGQGMDAGFARYAKNVGTLSENIANATVNAFGKMEDMMVNWIETGKFRFKDFANSVISDLNRIIIRQQILGPLARSLTSSGGSSNVLIPANGATDLASTNAYAAKGAAFQQGLKRYASGGVIGTPTYFNHANGAGLMGEAGPEAIMPLTRLGNGNLGVQAAASPVNVTVINQAGAEVETKESVSSDGTRNIELIVRGIVRKSMTDGSMDKTLSQNYNLRRRSF